MVDNAQYHTTSHSHDIIFNHQKVTSIPTTSDSFMQTQQPERIRDELELAVGDLNSSDLLSRGILDQNNKDYVKPSGRFQQEPPTKLSTDNSKSQYPDLDKNLMMSVEKILDDIKKQSN